MLQHPETGIKKIVPSSSIHVPALRDDVIFLFVVCYPWQMSRNMKGDEKRDDCLTFEYPFEIIYLASDSQDVD